jgi:hypothetical protein
MLFANNFKIKYGFGNFGCLLEYAEKKLAEFVQ